VRIARRDPLISHILITLFSFSFFSLAFVGLMPVIAEKSFDIGPKSWQYGVLYACLNTTPSSTSPTTPHCTCRGASSSALRDAYSAMKIALQSRSKAGAAWNKPLGAFATSPLAVPDTRSAGGRYGSYSHDSAQR